MSEKEQIEEIRCVLTGEAYVQAQEDNDKIVRLAEENKRRLKEEIERLRKMPEKVYAEMTERLKAEVAIERRMTAKKIYEELKDMSMWTDGITGQYQVVSMDGIKSVCEKYGVEIDE